MAFTKEKTIGLAKDDLATRLKIKVKDIKQVGVADQEFSDMSLGAPADGEMAAQMISNGWRIELSAEGKKYEYRADKYQLRLHNFKGKNYVLQS